MRNNPRLQAVHLLVSKLSIWQLLNSHHENPAPGDPAELKTIHKIGAALTRVLKTNFELCKFTIKKSGFDGVHEGNIFHHWKASFYLKLNRIGRRHLHHKTTSQEWLETIISNRDDPSVVLYSLLCNPDVLTPVVRRGASSKERPPPALTTPVVLRGTSSKERPPPAFTSPVLLRVTSSEERSTKRHKVSV